MPHVMISRKKCTGCHMCELACSAYHEGAYRPSVARLYSECNPTTTEIKGHTCLQTGCAKCQDACPTDAIVAPGVVDANRCLAWLVQRPGTFPHEFREALGDRLSVTTVPGDHIVLWDAYEETAAAIEEFLAATG